MYDSPDRLKTDAVSACLCGAEFSALLLYFAAVGVRNRDIQIAVFLCVRDKENLGVRFRSLFGGCNGVVEHVADDGAELVVRNHNIAGDVEPCRQLYALPARVVDVVVGDGVERLVIAVESRSGGGVDARAIVAEKLPQLFGLSARRERLGGLCHIYKVVSEPRCALEVLLEVVVLSSLQAEQLGVVFGFRLVVYRLCYAVEHDQKDDVKRRKQNFDNDVQLKHLSDAHVGVVLGYHQHVCRGDYSRYNPDKAPDGADILVVDKPAQLCQIEKLKKEEQQRNAPFYRKLDN